MLLYQIGNYFFHDEAVTILNANVENVFVDIEIGAIKRHLKWYILGNFV